MKTLVRGRRIQNKIVNVGARGMFDLGRYASHLGLQPTTVVTEDQIPCVATGRILRRDEAYAEVEPNNGPENFDKDVGDFETSFDEED